MRHASMVFRQEGDGVCQFFNTSIPLDRDKEIVDAHDINLGRAKVCRCEVEKIRLGFPIVIHNIMYVNE